MNFLAHLYLSEPCEESQLGNFLTDFIHKPEESNFSPAIQNGIRLHRKIDKFTDHHPIVQKTKQQVLEKNRRFAGIITDILFDHFLSRSWSGYSHEPLETFVENFYQLLENKVSLLPPRLKRVLPILRNENWLLSYGTLQGVEQTLTRLSEKRLKGRIAVAEEMDNLHQQYADFESDFQAFFPQLNAYVESLRNPQQMQA